MRIIDSPKHRAQALVLALGIAILIALAPFATGLLGAAVLHVLFVPLHRRLSRHISAGLAAATVTTLAAIVLLLPVVWLVGSAVYEAPDIVRNLQKSSFQQRLSALRIADVAVGTQNRRGKRYHEEYAAPTPAVAAMTGVPAASPISPPVQ